MKFLLFTFVIFFGSCKKHESPKLLPPSTGTIVIPGTTPKSPPGTYTYLALGDSYTVGHGVSFGESFPGQLVDTLSKSGFKSTLKTVIAGTGWRTSELKSNLIRQNPNRTFDIVTLLIGVNNQYQGFSRESYRAEFSELLDIAIKFAAGDNTKVFVLSIPDWGVTPYARSFGNGDAGTISLQINQYNAINKQEAEKRLVSYIDVAPISRMASNDLSLLASDYLHPSGKMYAMWVNLLAPKVVAKLK